MGVPMPWEFNDGGRSTYFRGSAGDCVTRAIAIATGRDYKQVYDDLREMKRARNERLVRRGKATGSSSPRDGVHRDVIRAYLDPDFERVAFMGIGTGTTVHLTPDELPARGIYILNLSKHLCALVDGIVQDTHDPSRDGTRCVYGLWVVDGRDSLGGRLNA